MTYRGTYCDDNGIVWEMWQQEKTCDFQTELEKIKGRKLRCVENSNGPINAKYI